MPAHTTRHLALLVFSQFAGTSLWFAGNAIVDQVSTSDSGANITSYVQFGFIAGTLVFSLLTIADRFPARKVFFYSAFIAALANLCIIPFHHLPMAVPLLRFLTGFVLAGIYPVGMKIAADVFPQQLGKALGLLVGALVMGTAFPHFVRSQLGGLNWQVVIYATSALAMLGGALVLLFIPATTKAPILIRPDLLAAFRVFHRRDFRSAAFGYFGHMWELYSFWAILPTLFLAYNAFHQRSENTFWWSFLAIAVGSLGCAFGGLLSQRWGSKSVAFYALLLSGTCCLLAPVVFRLDAFLFYPFVLFWGVVVVTDSPQFSALVAKAADENVKGTALTIVTSIGFAITIASIQLLKELFASQRETALLLLAPGPLLGLVALKLIK